MKTTGDYLSSCGIPLPRKLGVRKYIYLSYVRVEKGYRREGWASKLLNRFFAAHDKEHIYIMLVDEHYISNGTVLRDFMKNHGFRIVGTMKNKRGKAIEIHMLKRSKK